MPPLSKTRESAEAQWQRENPGIQVDPRWLVGAMDAEAFLLERRLACLEHRADGLQRRIDESLEAILTNEREKSPKIPH